MKLNDTIAKVSKKIGVDPISAYTFCFLAEHFGDAGIEYMIDTGMLTSENEQKYRINFLDYIASEVEVELKYPIFSVAEKGMFNTFCEALQARGLGVFGVDNQSQTYAVFTGDKSEREAFEEAILQIGELNVDLDRLADSTIAYYAQAERAMKLANYLTKLAVQQYKLHAPSQRHNNLL